MRIKLGAFPAVYFTAKCNRHDCWVEVRVLGSTDRSDRHVIGGQLTAVMCEKGGEAKTAKCTDDWEMSISGSGGDIIVTK